MRRRLGLTLSRLGYDVVALTPVSPGESADEQSLGSVRVVPVPVGTAHRDAVTSAIRRRRLRRYPVFSRLDRGAYSARYAQRQQKVRKRDNQLKNIRKRSGGTLTGKLRWSMPWALLRAEVAARKSVIRFAGWRQRRQMWVDKLARQGWAGRWTDVSRRATVFATVRGMLPEVLDLHQAYAPVLTALEPDILHVHHPFLLPTAAAVPEVLSSRGRQVSLLYDARENFAGIPPEEQGNRRRHHVVVSLEARTIRTADMVTTVSPLIAQELRERYGLRELPTTVLNMPVLRDEQGAPGTTVRDLAGVGPATALLVYSGTMSRARGMEVLIDALAYVPNAVLALVTVPYPHPMTAGLMDRATRLEVADRIRVLPPVGQDELVPFLSGADVGVHPLPSGSPNHDMAMPNKLYEYLHAGLTLVVSDARAVAEFVHVHGVGEVFRSGDAVDMARAIRAALEGRDGHDPRARRELARSASWQSQESTIAMVYQRMATVPPRTLPIAFPALDVAAGASHHHAGRGT